MPPPLRPDPTEAATTPDPTDPISSPRNRRVGEAAALHRARRRRESGRTLLEGPKLIDEALSSGATLERIFARPADAALVERARAAGTEILVVADNVIKRLGSTETPQSPIAVLVTPDPDLPDGGDLLVAWGVRDPGNAGTLIRTAAAFGWGFAAGPETVDVWSPKVLRSAAGAHFHTAVARVRTPEDLAGWNLVATVPADGEAPSSLRGVGRRAVLVGEEAAGLPPDVIAAAAHRVTIPMPGGTESLNAAVAGAIVVYEAAVGDGPAV